MKKVRIIAIIVVCIFIFGIYNFQVINTKRNYEKAIEYYNNGDYEQAASILEYIEYKDSKIYCDKANYELGKLAYEEGKIVKAVYYFKEINNISIDSEGIYDKCKYLELIQGKWYSLDNDGDDLITIISGNEYRNIFYSKLSGERYGPYVYQITYIDKERMIIEGERNGDKIKADYTYKIENDVLKYHAYESKSESELEFYEKKKITDEEELEIVRKADTLVSEDPYIGMSREKLANSTWGSPEDINKTTYSWGTKEQWVYSGYRYIYLEDGVVTAIQE